MTVIPILLILAHYGYSTLMNAHRNRSTTHTAIRPTPATNCARMLKIRSANQLWQPPWLCFYATFILRDVYDKLMAQATPIKKITCMCSLFPDNPSSRFLNYGVMPPTLSSNRNLRNYLKSAYCGLLDDSVVSRFVCLQTDHNNNKNGGLWLDIQT